MDNAPDRIWAWKTPEGKEQWYDSICHWMGVGAVEYIRATPTSPLGAVAMRDAASALAMQWVEGDCTCPRCLDATHITDAIRALPIPPDADIDRAALDRPKVRALVDLLREAAADLTAYVGAEYPLHDHARYPEIAKRHFRDMELVRRINAALEASHD